MTQMNLSVKQKQRHERREQECGCQGTGVGEGGLGRKPPNRSFWEQTIHGPSHSERYSSFLSVQKPGLLLKPPHGKPLLPEPAQRGSLQSARPRGLCVYALTRG